MSNTNCLEGVKCPVCANEYVFFIQTRALATVTDAGVDDNGDQEWDDTSYTRCGECDEDGYLAHFRRQELDVTKALRHVLHTVVRCYAHLLDERMLRHDAEMLRRLLEVVATEGEALSAADA